MPLSTLTNPVVCKYCNRERVRFTSSEKEKCTSCYKKEYYKKNAKKIKEQNNTWKRNNIEKYRYIQSNNREKKRIINYCPNCNRVCHNTKHFKEVKMCRGCFDVKEKERKYNEKILKKNNHRRQPKQVSKEKAHEYYLNYYYKNRESILEKKRSKLFLLKQEDQDDFEFYLQKEREEFKSIWEKESGKLIEDIRVKVYRDLKKNTVFKKSNSSKRKIRYCTSATLGKNILVKNRKSFDWTILKDMISFQEHLKTYGLENSSLFNPDVEEIIKQKAYKDKDAKRLYQVKYNANRKEMSKMQ